MIDDVFVFQWMKCGDEDYPTSDYLLFRGVERGWLECHWI